jgi:hypothetical protein
MRLALVARKTELQLSSGTMSFERYRLIMAQACLLTVLGASATAEVAVLRDLLSGSADDLRKSIQQQSGSSR